MIRKRDTRPNPDSIDALSDQVGDVCATLRAMANETRLRILCVLFEGELPVNQIAEAVGQSLSAASQHLSKLKAEGLVASRRDGQTILYRSTGGVGTAVIQTLCRFYQR
ncbi:MAG: metalloregulator ArsR/SmtB family transcription factor [Hyphomonas sp.]|nr:metalloregulator ArsR/SmtB family transcription factor [Hyphomonas sp.]